MTSHIIPAADQISLLTLEEARDFNACKELISLAISKACVGTDEDMRYELGAAYLRLSIYQLATCEYAGYAENMKKANALLPRADLLALAASWLDRVGENEEKVLEFCAEFFDVVDVKYKQPDCVSRSHFEAMEELRARFSVGH